eukprot:TRINITY_DN718_c0_g1_i1.p1 TRINITY_DN718_c0_g1~~TRINITY_DN718_c0_g1_i1.p1  ORF type:complete len:865 (+),score=138.88 TRINITY_DN718_c0_g1_i1:49-2643(+)
MSSSSFLLLLLLVMVVVVVVDGNVLANGDNDSSSSSSMPGWTTSGSSFTYSKSGVVPQTSPNFFYCPGASCTATSDDFDLKAHYGRSALYRVSGYFSTAGHDNDYSGASVTFQFADGGTISHSLSVPSPPISDWTEASAEVCVKAGTESGKFILSATRVGGSTNNAYSDSLSVVFLNSGCLQGSDDQFDACADQPDLCTAPEICFQDAATGAAYCGEFNPPTPVPLPPVSPPTSSPSPSPSEEDRDCAGDWSTFSDCSEPCGPGTRTRTFEVKQTPLGNGQACPDPETESCDLGPCDGDCQGTWSEWTTCSEDCGGGERSSSFTVIDDATGEGAACPDSPMTEPCNEDPCPVDCEGAYSEWSVCDNPCGGGTRHQDYVITTQPVGDGEPCPDSPRINEPCNEQACDVNCAGSYGSWSQCSADCDGGTQRRDYTVTQEQEGNGDPCPAEYEERTCNEHLCDVDCEGEYSDYGDCSESCGGGVQYADYQISVHPVAGGQQCPTPRIQRDCNTHLCDTDCEVGAWSSYTSCSKSCGTGTKYRTREITVQPVAGGGACPVLQQTTYCNTHVCDVDCEVSGWGPFTDCSVPCGDGYQTRTQTVTVEPAGNGAPCPALTENLSCNLKECDRDCVMSSWAEWSACSVSCGNGSRYRSRYIETNPVGEGLQCGAEIDIDTCGDGRTDCEDVDCVLSEYDEWTECNEECGGGTRSRSRSIEVAAAAGGLPCDELTQKEACNSKLCAVDCEVTNWSVYGDCDVECGGGVRIRTREVDVLPRGDGLVCPELSMSDPNGCNNIECDDQGLPVVSGNSTSAVVTEGDDFMGVGLGLGIAIIIIIALVVLAIIGVAVFFLVFKKTSTGDSNDFFLNDA